MSQTIRVGDTFLSLEVALQPKLRVVLEQIDAPATAPSIAVAICPSNQDRNASPVRPEYNEYGGMHWLAPLIEERCQQLGINAKVFATTPESQDTAHLAGLYAQQRAADAWLTQRTERQKVLVNLHTDSGSLSHTFAIYGTQYPQSKTLAEAIGPLVHAALETASYQAFSQLGSTDYSTYVFAQVPKFPACLIELCSHVNAADINHLFERPQQVAEEIAKGILAYSGG